MKEFGNTTGYNAVLTIQSEFPALTYSLNADTWIKQLFKSVQNLADYTKKQLIEGNYQEVEHCYRTAHEILKNGGNISKAAIENVFVSRISKVLEVSFAVPVQARHQFLSFFKKRYCKKINASLA